MARKKREFAYEIQDVLEFMDMFQQQNAELLEWYAKWLRDRSVRGKPVTLVAAQLQLQDCAVLPDGGVAMIKNSIKNGYQGLFEEKKNVTRTRITIDHSKGF